MPRYDKRSTKFSTILWLVLGAIGLSAIGVWALVGRVRVVAERMRSDEVWSAFEKGLAEDNQFALANKVSEDAVLLRKIDRAEATLPHLNGVRAAYMQAMLVMYEQSLSALMAEQRALEEHDKATVELKLVKTKAELEKRKIAVQNLRAAKTQSFKTRAGMADIIEAELRRLQVSEPETKAFADTFRPRKKMPEEEAHLLDDRILGLAFDKLDLLDKKWGGWRIGKDGATEFADEADGRRYRQLSEELKAATAERIRMAEGASTRSNGSTPAPRDVTPASEQP